MTKLKNRPSQLSLKINGLDNTEDEQPAPALTTTSSTYSFVDEADEASDKPSPLKGSVHNNTTAPEGEGGEEENLDISGGIGTPCYVVDMDNIFDEDHILGKGPKKPCCLSLRKLCGKSNTKVPENEKD